jgi:peptidoglycan hydrolase-like protein with peptidoglycan-binding domain
MKRAVFIIMLFFLMGMFYGCGKKQQTLEEMQQPMSMETLVTMSTTSAVPSETKITEAKATVPSILGPAAASNIKLEQLPPSGPYKPTANEIQIALQNAGFYTGAIDGKIGPVSKKAIIEFQKSNDLVADGKVGPQTWEELSRYLNPVTQNTGKSR